MGTPPGPGKCPYPGDCSRKMVEVCETRRKQKKYQTGPHNIISSTTGNSYSIVFISVVTL